MTAKDVMDQFAQKLSGMEVHKVGYETMKCHSEALQALALAVLAETAAKYVDAVVYQMTHKDPLIAPLSKEPK